MKERNFSKVILLTIFTAVMAEESNGTLWMYENDKKVDLEQYLLGRKIDDAVDPTKVEDKHTDWLSGMYFTGFFLKSKMLRKL